MTQFFETITYLIFFLVITKAAEFEHVEESRRDVSLSLNRERKATIYKQLMSFQSNCRLVLKPGLDILNIHSECRIRCFVDNIWFTNVIFTQWYVYCENILFIMRKSSDGHAQTSVTSPFLKLMKFYATCELRIKC